VYPFQHWQAQGGRFGYGFEFFTPFVAAAQIALVFILLWIVDDRPIAAYFIALGVVVIICIHATIDWARSINIRAAPRRRSRYFWALSFWDVGQARKILSGVPNPIPSSAAFVDLAFMASLIAVCFVLGWRGWDDNNESLALAKIFLTMFFGVSSMPYGVRLALLIYFRLQWYFSTFEYRTDSYTSPRVKVALKFISTLLQANFYAQFNSLLAILLFVFVCFITIEYWKGQKSLEKDGAYYIGLISLLALLVVCFCVVITSLVYGTSLIIRDTRRRIQWIYEGNSEEEASSRDIQLV